MRPYQKGLPVIATLFIGVIGVVGAGERVDVNSLSYGMRYCPAPWCDNSEFIDTHFGIDAQTGKMTKYVGGSNPYEEEVTSNGEEIVLWTPTSSAGNNYIRPDDALATRPPARISTGDRTMSRPASQQPSRGSVGTGRPTVSSTQKTNDSAQIAKRPWWKIFTR